jgi:phenylacetic acid degradation operon negative regulatory protein
LFEQNGRKFPKNSTKKQAARSLYGLQKNTLIRITKRNGKFEIRLTEKGRKKFKEVQLENIQIVKPPRWDGKWRVLIFDIPENSRRYAREVLRGKVKQWGFYQLQKSVWVCPWPCEDEIQLAAELYEVAPFVNIIIADKIMEDTFLQKHFGL